ncbi:MAG TPA: hypothetical protein VL728_02150 [Cyclobacteriaceae bacterium]|nr:hypothetical protein [Cyclobacteriaceae bacterium]
MKRVIFLITAFLFVSVLNASAQCAMCRATLENNISNGNIGIAAGINFGIMYLFFSPYVFILLLAYFWYRTSKRNANKSIESNWAG